MPADQQEAVRRTLARLSAVWQARRYEELATLFAADIVFALPGFAGRLEGAAAVVASYREFMERATLTGYKEESPHIDVWGDTAVASFGWEMVWLASGVVNAASGHDVFVFRRAPLAAAGARPWLACWRTMIFTPSVTSVSAP